MPTHNYSEYAEYKGTTAGLCTSCGFWHLLSPKTDEYYESDQFYSLHAPPDWFVKEKREHDGGLWNACYDYQIGLLQKHLPMQFWNYRSFLDVGCGTGWFVQHAHKRGYACQGVDPSNSARAFLNLDCVFKTIPDVRYNAIRASLVLEHIPTPELELFNWRNHLYDNGLLMIIVPNDFSPLQKRLKTHHFISPVHANYFQLDTLTNLLERCGFEVIHKGATFPMELPLCLGYDYRGNDIKGRRVHNFRLRFEKLMGVRAFQLYKRLFDWWGWGRELIFVARKI